MRGTTWSGGAYAQVCSLEGGLWGPPPENFGISGAQRVHFTPPEASLQINYQIPRGGPKKNSAGWAYNVPIDTQLHYIVHSRCHVYTCTGFLLGMFGRGGKSRVLPGVGGLHASLLLRGNFGISGAQRAHFTPSEKKKTASKGGQMPPRPAPKRNPIYCPLLGGSFVLESTTPGTRQVSAVPEVRGVSISEVTNVLALC